MTNGLKIQFDHNRRSQTVEKIQSQHETVTNCLCNVTFYGETRYSLRRKCREGLDFINQELIAL